MKIRLFDKIAGVPAGTVKDVPKHVADKMIANGYGEAVEDESPAAPVPSSKPKKTKK